ncbi:GntR family transcriptional regulator [Comamonas sp. J-3]|uniref:GntR family transcriptional regulator n=1 Tax=Comamonas trifloxystrobinivorans TaxID=3350256 RepID=UPI003726B2DF
MTPNRPATASIATDIYQLLRDKILSHEAKPGDRMVEDEICERLSAGRTPVREALLRLQGEGLVTRSRGWVVGTGAPLAFRSIFEGRMAIEGYATRLAAERSTPETVAELRSLLQQMDAAEAISRSEVNRLNQIFHRRLVALSENPYFVEQHARTQFHYWSLRLPVIFAQDQLSHSAVQHLEILEAVERHDGDLAEKLTREHIASTMRIVADALGER